MLSTPASGVVAEVNVQAGDVIRQGQTLLRLQQNALRADLEQARAQRRYQQMQNEEATRELERAEELYERTVLADHELELAKIAAARAEASYQQARASEQLARQALADSELRAPFDGLVIARHVQPGETVANRHTATRMLELADSSRMLAEVALAADAVTGLRVGAEMAVEVAGERYPGVLEAIQYRHGESRPYLLQVSFPLQGPMQAGLPARVRRP